MSSIKKAGNRTCRVVRVLHQDNTRFLNNTVLPKNLVFRIVVDREDNNRYGYFLLKIRKFYVDPEISESSFEDFGTGDIGIHVVNE